MEDGNWTLKFTSFLNKKQREPTTH